jgi:single-stranded-DNA-specific exonuclease
MTRWIDPPSASPPESFSDLRLHPLAAQILHRRGISTLADARAFLDPDAYSPAPASDIPDMERAAERIREAIREGEEICIWGDFDVDGQTSTTILVQTLRALGADPCWHIPVRATESHGIKIPFLRKELDKGIRLLLTCDTGISETEAITYANSRGVDVLITDHHALPPALPNALAAVNPNRLPEEHPLATLPGAGVAYKLAELLLEGTAFSPEELLDLVALGIVADVAEQRGDARYLLQKGLTRLRDTQRIGLRALYDIAELRAEELNEEHIGFLLAPRMNALGRLDDANPIVDFLTTRDAVYARVFAEQLEGLNARRKFLVRQVYAAAEKQIENTPALLDSPVLVLAHSGWEGGVIGIAASRLVERYHRPVLLLTIGEDGIARGSARSIEGIHITQAIAAQKTLLLGFGGHPMAAGLSLPVENLDAFRRGIANTVQEMVRRAALPEAAISLDAWLSLDDITLSLAAALEPLSPFGAGNPAPIFATRNLRVKSRAEIGKEKEHLRWVVDDESGNVQEVLWWNGAGEESPPDNAQFDLAYHLRASSYRGEKRVQLELVDFHVTRAAAVEIRVKSARKITDWREEISPREKVESLEDAVIWEEGSRELGVRRDALTKAKTLVVWTTPPSPRAFRRAVETVDPEEVVLVFQDPQAFTPDSFLRHLSGIVKFILNRKEGKASLLEVAAAMAEREEAIRIGLDILAAKGFCRVAYEKETLTLSEGGEKSPEDAATRYVQLKRILKETAAYRRHCRRAAAEHFAD